MAGFSYEDASKPQDGGFSYDEAAPPKPAEPGFIPTVKRTGGQMLTTLATSIDDLTGPNRVTGAIRDTGQGIIDRNPAGINGIGDIIESPWLTVKEATGQFVPQIAAAAAGGLAGAAAGKRIAGTPGAVIGGGIGSLVPIFTQEYGGIRQDQQESGQESIPRALGAATAATALERVGLGKAIKFLRAPGSVPISTIPREIAKGVLKEGATEAAQTSVEQVGAFKDPTTSESLNEAAFSGVMGGIGGGVVGGTMGAAGKVIPRKSIDAPTANTGQPAQPVVPAATAPTPGDAIRATAPPVTGPLTGALAAGTEAAAQAADAGVAPLPVGQAQELDVDPATLMRQGVTPEQAAQRGARRIEIDRFRFQNLQGADTLAAGALDPGFDARELSLEEAAALAARPTEQAERIPVGRAREVPVDTVEPADAGGPDLLRSKDVKREPRTPKPQATRDMTDADVVKAYVEQRRIEGTLAGRRFAGDFDAGRITPADVLALVRPRTEATPDERLAAAAAQAPKPNGGIVVSTASKQPRESSRVDQPDAPRTARGTADAGTGRTPVPGGSGVAVGRVAADAGQRQPGSAAATVAGGGEVRPAGDGLPGDAPLTVLQLKRAWSDAVARGDTEAARAINEQIVEAKKAAPNAAAPVSTQAPAQARVTDAAAPAPKNAETAAAAPVAESTAPDQPKTLKERREAAKAAPETTATAQPAPASESVAAQQAAPSANTIFTEDAAAAARARLKAKLGRLQSGLDPETIMDGITLAGYHIEKGVRTFAAYARAMVDDLGDAVKPYLQSWYMAVRSDPRAAGFKADMDKASAVEDIDVDAVLAERDPEADQRAAVAEVARRRALGDEQRMGTVEATHKDPGDPAEPVTAEVVAEVIEKAAKNTDRTRSEMKAEALRLVDEAIAKAPDKGDKKITISVPGDGVFKVVNNVTRLKEFRRQIELSPGFKDKLPTYPIGKAASGGNYGPDQLAREMLEDGEPVNAVEILEAAGKTMMFGNGNGASIPYTNAEPVEIAGIDDLFVGRGFGTKKGATSWWSVVHKGSGFAIGGSQGSKADAIAEAKKLLGQPEKREKMRDLIESGKSADGRDFMTQDELREQFMKEAEGKQQATFNANDANIARAAQQKKQEAERDAFYKSIMGDAGLERPAKADWTASSIKEFLDAAEKKGEGEAALKFMDDVVSEFSSPHIAEWKKSYDRRNKPSDTGWMTGFQAPGGLRRIRRDVKHPDGTTYRAELDEFAGAYVTGKVEQWTSEDGRPRTVQTYSNDMDARAKADKFLDSVVALRKPKPNAGPEAPALDLMGFERIPKGNGAFDLRDSNMLVRVEPTERGKYRAAMGSAKSGPGLTEQQAVEWAAAYRAESLRVQAANAKKPVTPATQAAAPEAAAEPVKAKEGAAEPTKANTEDAGEELTYNRRNRIKTGLKWSDIAGKNEALKVKEAVKQNVYPRPDYEALVDGGMQPIVAHIVKQVYDSIAAKPNMNGIPKDVDLQTYMEGINRVMTGVMAWANNPASVAAWAKSEASGAAAALGRVTNLSDLTGPTGGKSMLETVYPQGWKDNRAEVILLGGNKLLGKLQPGYDEGKAAIKAINAGWPASQEAWQKQGLRVVLADKIDVRYYASKRTKTDEPYVSINYSVGGKPYFQDVVDGVESESAPEVIAKVKAEIDATQGKWLLTDKYGRVKERHATEEEAKESARASVKRAGKGGGPDESGIAVGMARREGPAYRMEGQNVSSDDVKAAFGFKGVNFGTWMKGDGPALVAERQAHLNHAYDSMMDLSALFGVPPRAMSLNGMLGLAIGAQGTGGSKSAAAHFVPGVNEINLTRASGAGSLAHEWGHALDHYFAAQAGLAGASTPFLTTLSSRPVKGDIRPEIVTKFRAIVNAMEKAQETPEQMAARIEASKAAARKNVDGWLRAIKADFTAGKVDGEAFDKIAERIRTLDLGEGKIMASQALAISPALDDLRTLYKTATGKAYPIDKIKGLSSNVDHLAFVSADRAHVPQMVASEYAKNAAKLDKVFGSGKPYWSTTLEMFARAFDAFVSDSLEAKAAKNTYLSHAGRINETTPMGAERATINEAFKALVAEIKTRETPVTEEGGQPNVAMFSRGAATPRGLSLDEAEAIVGAVREANPTAPPMIVLESVDQAPTALRRDIEAAGAANDVEAAYHEGKVYVFAPHLRSMERAMFVIAHHELRHHGMRSLEGRRLNTALADMVMSNAKLRDAAQAKMDAGLAKDMIQGAEEALADMDVSEVQALKGWPKVLAAVRQWLRGMATRLRAKGHTTLADAIDPKDWTDADVAGFVARAEAVSKGGRAKFGTDGTVFQRAWHGTPHRGITEFSTDKIGSGEGAQAYGWGLYFASKRDVADYYRKALTMDGSINRGGKLERLYDYQVATPEYDALKLFAEAFRQGKTSEQAVEEARAYLDQIASLPGKDAHWQRVERAIRAYVKVMERWAQEGVSKSVGQLYEVDVPEDSELLLWDKPVQEQAPKVKEALYAMNGGYTTVGGARKFIEPPSARMTGQQVYRNLSLLMGGDINASKALAEAGIRGLKYLDGASRRSGDGSSNFVIFDGADAEIQGAVYSRAPTTLAERRAAAQQPAAFSRAEPARDDYGRFSRIAPTAGPGMAQQRPVREAVRNTLADMLGSAGAKVSWWDKTLGTQYAKAQKFPGFKRVFDQVQQYLEDTSSLANEAAGKAKDILPKLETWKDLGKFGLNKADSKAIAAPIFQGTLTDKQVYSDAELRSQFNLNDKQIGYYRQFLDAVNTSLDQAVAADVLRSLGDKNPALRELAITGREALREGVIEFLNRRIEEGVDAEKNAELLKDIEDRYARIDKLKAEGYAPLMRFGKYKLHITDAEGGTLFFGLYESRGDANRAARELSSDPAFQGATFEQGVLSQEQYKMFAAMPLDSMEMFAEAIGAEKSEVFQEYIRLAKNNRSALKRLIERKGTAGFVEDVPRVLAAFVTSNARLASSALNMPAAKDAALDIRDGDVQDEAVKLIDAVQNPKETAGAVRGLLFANFIGGSIASAVVNVTQPITMTLPYLSQWGGPAKAGARLMAAGKMAASGKVSDPELRAALKQAEDGGVVSPQEIHHLTAQAMGTMGNHPLLQRAAFIWAGPFSLAEQFNRRVSFIAAYNTAKEQGIQDAYGFAEKAVIETQGLYSKANAPNWARNPIGATALTFKQYSIHYLEWMGRMWNAGRPGSPERRAGRAAVGVALALLVLAAGTDGLPFAEDLDDLIDTLGQALGYDMNSKRARRDFVANTLGLGGQFADITARGFSAAPGIPLDVSMRMSMGNLIPASGVLLRSNVDRSSSILEVAGPAGGLAKQALDASQKLLAGDLTGAGTAALPVALQNVIKAVGMWTTGEARDTRDRKVMDADEVDGLMKFLGFNPQAIARESEKMGMIRRSEQLAKNVEGEIAGKWARAVADKDMEAMADARRQLAQWNTDNPGQPIRITPAQILQRARKLAQDREARFISSVSKERRAEVAEALR